MRDYRISGHEPTIEELMADLGVSSEAEIRPVLLNKLKLLRELAHKRGDIRRFEESPHDFILCDSGEFYQTLVDMGHGNMALTIYDDWNKDVFFLLFKDKVPEDFYAMPVTHESTEYGELQKGLDQATAHRIASKKGIERAEELGKKQDYVRFLKEKYFGIYTELKEWGLIK